MITATNPKFPLGEVVITANANGQLEPMDITLALTRHARGDWGDILDAHRNENELALREDFRLMSVYKSARGVFFWVITEADRSVTTILLPEDY